MVHQIIESDHYQSIVLKYCIKYYTTKYAKWPLPIKYSKLSHKILYHKIFKVAAACSKTRACVAPATNHKYS